ncbi:hypothetical protein K438DRAFT_1939787 [Mycena galopus ATCC 62051]|nr:hypothetical protein K438DRAFT_1939787 [Mycena galopus ATCC 62051]
MSWMSVVVLLAPIHCKNKRSSPPGPAASTVSNHGRTHGQSVDLCGMRLLAQRPLHPLSRHTPALPLPPSHRIRIALIWTPHSVWARWTGLGMRAKRRVDAEVRVLAVTFLSSLLTVLFLRLGTCADAGDALSHPCRNGLCVKVLQHPPTDARMGRVDSHALALMPRDMGGCHHHWNCGACAPSSGVESDRLYRHRISAALIWTPHSVGARWTGQGMRTKGGVDAERISAECSARGMR